MSTDPTPRANPTPPLIVRYEFEITDEHDETVASGDAPTLEEAEREGRHYLAKYQQDGPCTLELRRVEVLEVSRTDSTPTQASESHADEELSDEQLMEIGCKELYWQVLASLVRPVQPPA